MTDTLLFIWDIDGTLLLTGGAGKISFNRVFGEHFNQDNLWGQMRPDGKTDGVIIAELFEAGFGRKPSPEELSLITTRYIELMLEQIPLSPRFRLLPGVTETLAWLKQQSTWHCGLATGNFVETARCKLHRAGLDHYFSFGGYGSDSTDRLELTRTALARGIHMTSETPKQVFLIGDTVYDVRCGQALNCTTIAVATGSTSKAELAAAGADYVLEDLTGFKALVESCLMD